MSERDLDLFQLEELHSGNGYAEWFAEKIGLAGYEFETARHSVVGAANGKSGETDVLAMFTHEMLRCAVFIEDKISAAFTDDQAKRYVERANALVVAGEASSFLTVLVAPAIYLKSVSVSDPWNVKVPMEEIEGWFAGKANHHAIWRSIALRAVLARITRNQNATTEEIAKFSLAFSRYLSNFHAPYLSHNPGKDKSGPIIRFPGSSVNKTLWWKVAKNQMTLQLMNEYQGLAEKIKLPTGVEIERAADHGRKCDYLVAPAATVDLTGEFEQQSEAVEAAIQVALRIVSVIPQLEALLGATKPT